ncbi:MAG: endonuclease/exonuclease/phosphatase family protein [Flavobacteriales bacterium]|nr:endonuclease/exonuclease/phosphatase family protein [Flavobacteriales bacterium]MCX7767500.1 endonuclease/exonuclease/phosphatase family protein [Flavobacteriales bacterium]MDW8409635.1 endonuclease/exonuclease/phosphatase family protein [Flavobacteriales bacterium]
MRRLLFFFNLLIALGLAAALAAPYVSPARFYPLAYFGLTTYFWVAANAVFVLLWIILRLRNALLSTVLLIAAWPSLSNLLGLNWREQIFGGNAGIKVMSYNVRLFGLYDWKNNIRHRNDILNFLKKQEPDIVCFQEFFVEKENGRRPRFSTEDTLKKLLLARNIHFEAASSLYGTQFWGVATFSRFPIVNRGKIRFPGSKGNICIYSDIQIGNDTVRVYNVHFESYHLPEEKFDRLADDIQENPEYWWGVFRRMAHSYERRAQQADSVRKSIELSPHPVLVCGDFNELPTSYVYRTVGRGLRDAFLESGWGLGTTYAGRIPFLRIDYILHSPKIRSTGFKVYRHKLSDHFPISCFISLEDEL